MILKWNLGATGSATRWRCGEVACVAASGLWTWVSSGATGLALVFSLLLSARETISMVLPARDASVAAVALEMYIRVRFSSLSLSDRSAAVVVECTDVDCAAGSLSKKEGRGKRNPKSPNPKPERKIGKREKDKRRTRRTQRLFPHPQKETSLRHSTVAFRVP